MLTYIKAITLILENSFTAFIESMIVVFFPLGAGVAITALVVKLIKADADKLSIVLHGFVFSTFGLAVAYLYVENKTDAFSQILPQAIGAVVLIFQMLGRLNPKWDVPLDTQASLTGATAGIFCFVFGSIYFEEVRVNQPNNNGQNQSVSAGMPYVDEDDLAPEDLSGNDPDM